MLEGEAVYGIPIMQFGHVGVAGLQTVLQFSLRKLVGSMGRPKYHFPSGLVMQIHSRVAAYRCVNRFSWDCHFLALLFSLTIYSIVYIGLIVNTFFKKRFIFLFVFWY
jgi:hypothetical protein